MTYAMLDFVPTVLTAKYNGFTATIHEDGTGWALQIYDERRGAQDSLLDATFPDKNSAMWMAESFIGEWSSRTTDLPAAPKSLPPANRASDPAQLARMSDLMATLKAGLNGG